MKKYSAKSLILLLIFVSSFLPIVGLGVYAYGEAEDEIINEVYKQTDIALQNKSEQLDSYFFNALNETAFVSELSTFRELLIMNKEGNTKANYNQLSDQSTKLLRKKVDSSEFAYAYITNTNGVVLITTNSSKIPKESNLFSSGYIKESLNGEVSYSNLFLSKNTGVASLVASTPIYAFDNKTVVGTMNFLIESTGIDQVVHKNLGILGETGEAYLVSSDGLLMSNTRFGDDEELLNIVKETVVTDNLHEVMSNDLYDEIIHHTYENDEGVSLISSAKMTTLGDTPVGLVIEITVDEALKELASLRMTVLIAIILLAVFSIGFSLIISRSIISPIKSLTSKATAVAGGEINVELGQLENRKDDVGKLAVAFSQIIDGNKRKATLIQDIAHGKLSDMDLDDNSNDIVLKNIHEMTNILNDFSHTLKSSVINIRSGNFNEVIEENHLEGVYKELAMNVNQLINGFVSKFDDLSTPIYVVNNKMEYTYFNKAYSTLIKHSIEEKMGDEFSGSFDQIDQLEKATKEVLNTKNTSSGSDEVVVGDNKSYIDYLSVPIQNENDEVIGVFTTVTNNTHIVENQLILEKIQEYQSKNVDQLLFNLDKLSNGLFDMEYNELEYDQDTLQVYQTFKQINNTLTKSVTSIQSYVDEISVVLGELSNSNLDVNVDREYIGEFSSIKVALNTIIESFNDVVSKIYLSSRQVSVGATSMKNSALSLSSGATQQASSIEEVSATVTEIAAQVQENKNLVQKVKDLAEIGEANATKSDNQMIQMNQAMNDISSSSQSIQKVLKMINDIAFQTNILSLNAAVEAARAGQHGKGFAVIAEDVRNLALKSASAADQTSEMIEEIISRINIGKEIAEGTTNSLKLILNGTQETSDLSSKVALATEEQASAISQIELSINQIAEVVQGTSMNAQEGASTSTQLTSEALSLLKVVSSFNLKGIENLNVDLEEEVEEVIETEEVVIQLDNDIF